MGDDRDKKSWRERDRQNDSSSHRKEGGKKSSDEKKTDAKYKRDLDALFDGGDVPERFKSMIGDLAPDADSPEGVWRERIKELKAIESFRDFAKALTQFQKEGNAYPDDEDFLIRCLDHPSEKILAAVVAHIVDLAGRRELRRTGPMKSRIPTMRLVVEGPKTLELIDQLEELVG